MVIKIEVIFFSWEMQFCVVMLIVRIGGVGEISALRILLGENSRYSLLRTPDCIIISSFNMLIGLRTVSLSLHSICLSDSGLYHYLFIQYAYRTPDCIIISSFNMLIGLPHILADEREAKLKTSHLAYIG